MSEEIGFVMMRHVNSEASNFFWQECYSWLRKFYDWPIMIVDDNSTQEFLKSDIVLHNTLVVNSKFKSRGEILGLYYFYKLKPFQAAVFLHDSMFLKQRYHFESFTPDRPLLTFAEHEFDDDALCESFISLLNHHEPILETYRDKTKWKGCFGVMMYVTQDFLDVLDKRHDLFDTLLANIDARKKREQVERIFGCLFAMYGTQWPAIFGDIDFARKPTFDEYKQGVNSDQGYVKVFTGR